MYLGPMCSGKTSKLLELYQKETSEEKNCVMITPEIDSRTKNGIWTHDNKTFDGNVIWTNDILTRLSEIGNYDVIFINEAQFVNDIYEGVLVLTEHMNKKVYAAGLDGDFQRKPFENLINVIPLCDKILKLNARCEVCGKPAPFSKKLRGGKNKIEIGGKDMYEPRCREHFNCADPKE
jgi:thymidine kinase